MVRIKACRLTRNPQGLKNRPVLTARDVSSLREPHGPLAVP